MSEVAVPFFDHRSHPAPRPSVDLVKFAEEASMVRRIAQVICQTDFVPDAFRNKPDEVTAAMLYGRELGLSPMVAVQTINVIQRRPTLSANGMRGIAQAAGVVFEMLEASSSKVVMRARAPHQQAWTTSEWDLDRARKFDLLKKDNWQKQPQAMMQARCTSELCRLVAADVLIGMPYSSEELDDLDDESSEQRGATPAPRTVRRKTVPVYVPEDEAIADSILTEETTVFAPTDPPVTTGTRKALMAAFGEANIIERAARLKAASSLLGYEVKTFNSLTENSANLLLDMVREQLRQDDANDWPPVAEPAQ